LTIALPARAKLNLDLAVLGRREDGFHDVRTTLQAIDLHDLITLTPADQTTLTVSGLAAPNTSDNSVLRAHAAMEAAASKKLPTSIDLDKRIPPGAGMGGASSDAAATLRGLAALHHITTDLTSIAINLGADVPFFLRGGTAIAEQRGDHLTPIPTAPQWFAIAWPGVELLTSDVYRAWDQMPGDMPNQLARAAMSIEPRLKDFANALNSRSNQWQMTGSGSAFFRRCIDEESAQECVSNLNHLKCWTAVAQAIGPWA
jgi:4-diphosphocytidyl-2-C-methyl-D-erythritol kinase